MRERRRRVVWLPRICVPVEPGGNNGVPLRAGICGGASTMWLATQASNECSGAARACQRDMTAEARQLYVMDWWLLLGTSSDADTFAEGVSSRFVEHGSRVLARLAANPRGAVAMGHAWFGAQLIWEMNATLRHVGNIALDFHLGRAWSEFDCPAMQPSCAGPSCTGNDILTRSWQPPLVAAAVRAWGGSRHLRDRGVAAPAFPLNRSLPPPVTIPEPRGQMAGSCEERYFVCKKGSRMCVEAEAQADHPMDRHASRALFLGCAERICAPAQQQSSATSALLTRAPPRPPLNSSECAAALLRLFVHVSTNANVTSVDALSARSGGSGGSGVAGSSRRRAVAAVQASMEVLQARAAAGEATVDEVCADAWLRSGGARRTPVFLPRNATAL